MLIYRLQEALRQTGTRTSIIEIRDGERKFMCDDEETQIQMYICGKMTVGRGRGEERRKNKMKKK